MPEKFGGYIIYSYICRNKNRLLMVKKLLIISFLSVFTMGVPLIGYAAEMEAVTLEQTEDDIVITVSQSTVSISGASGMVLQIVSLTGKLVATYKIDAPAQRIELNIPKGCYILKIGKVVRKISIR